MMVSEHTAIFRPQRFPKVSEIHQINRNMKALMAQNSNEDMKELEH